MSFVELLFGDKRQSNYIASYNIKDVHYKTCWYWKIYTVNRVFIIIDSRYDCGIRKNTWYKY